MEWLSTWWGSLDIFTQALYCVAIPSTLILVIQSVLIIIGLGDGAPDINVSDTSGLDMPGCDCAGCDPTDALDAGSTDIVNPADAGALHLFTFQGIVTFLCVFAWAGILTYMGCKLIPVALIVGFILGAAAMFGVAKIIQLMGRLAESGNINAKNYLGETGTVYIPVPADGKGTGKINIALGERYVEFEAITEEAVELKSGETVRVTDIRSETILVVEKI
ncbi:MAG: NfeD family protein [Oscillospiraceae bacterium]|nr:NfeD family protein [Oscillospiraceae bacterium]